MSRTTTSATPGTAAGVPAGGAGAVEAAVALAEDLVGAWGSWAPVMTPDARRVAFVSDRSGTPQVWVQDVVTGLPEGAALPRAHHLPLGTPDPVVGVNWAADGRWLGVEVATGGGVRTEVWVARPDGTDARRIAGGAGAGDAEHAALGPWTRSGHRLVVTLPSPGAGRPTRSFLADPATGRLDPLAEGANTTVLDVSLEERFLVLKDGERGHQFCVAVDRLEDSSFPLLQPGATGSTDRAVLRPAPEGDSGPLWVYLASDVGLARRQLIGTALGPHGFTGEPRALAVRDDAELEGLDADDAGRLLLLVWNAAGRSELELFDTSTHARTPITGMPGQVAADPVLSRDGSSVVLGVEGPRRPRELWHVDVATGAWSRITHAPELPESSLVEPELVRFAGRDGLPLTGWLYRPHPSSSSSSGASTHPGPAALWLHGGPEAQERPTFNPQHQALAAAGIAVLAPNVRGSSGFGREFVHADDVEKRWDAFADVLAAADHLVATGVADPARIAVTGRSYGGYLVLASLAFSPGAFAAGVDVCGMSDLTTFYRDTEPWIGAVAVTKYGHPERDRALLEALSPLRAVDAVDAPLLVVHGEHDTNVPIGEARQVVAALRERAAVDESAPPVEYLELAGEGHDYRRADSRRTLHAAVVRFLAEHLGPL
ncbi:prolyl oligopeptidase family serine peptidase [Quadrisphaera sp. KR29]|uniref:prolyl oligopeptidase family serine peptidase n=1 Tax=Quadrisphaera sp. KR29 TaxID=3461391 RepID=UPI00404506D8